MKQMVFYTMMLH